MTRIILYLITIISTHGCYQTDSFPVNNENDLLNETFTITVMLENEVFRIFETKPEIHLFLDSVVSVINSCNIYDPNVFVLGFYVYESLEKDTIVSIEMIDWRNNYCSMTDGIFRFNNWWFIYNGIFLDDFFSITNKTIEFKCRRTYPVTHSGDNFFANFGFKIQKRKIIGMYFSACSNFQKELIIQHYSKLIKR